MKISKKLCLGLLAIATSLVGCAMDAGSDNQSTGDAELQESEHLLRGSNARDRDMARVVLPLYGALNSSSPSEIESLITRATSKDWQACGGNDVACGTRDQVIEGFKSRREAVPNLTWEIKEILVSGNRVIVRGEGSGTPVETFLNVVPTGKSFSVMSIDVHTIENRKIVRTYHIEDWLTGVAQLSP